MKKQYRAACAAAAIVLAAAAAGAAQNAFPRLPDGHPDFQGMYDLATLTPIERAAGQPATLTAEQAARVEQQVAARRARGRQPSRPDRQAPPVGGDGSTGAAGGVGGYNGFWVDAGDRYVVIDGLRRTSIVVDPADGRIPAVTSEARQRNAARAMPTSDAAESSSCDQLWEAS